MSSQTPQRRLSLLDLAKMRAVGVNDFGKNATQMLNLDQPALDWVALATGMGVEAVRVDSLEAFDDAFASAMRSPGPRLIEAVL